jgi:hypothetical protein
VASLSDAGWFAIHALAPITLGWLRFYREREPELFRVVPERAVHDRH